MASETASKSAMETVCGLKTVEVTVSSKQPGPGRE